MYRLPNGDVTEDSVTYGETWMDLAEIIGEATGASLYGFDPDLTFFDAARSNARMARLPAWFAIRLARALNEE